jgi:hypothetical protein
MFKRDGISPEVLAHAFRTVDLQFLEYLKVKYLEEGFDMTEVWWLLELVRGHL